ncbi:uncharacterized protein LOC144746789 [Ciona intestinalis]
MKSDKEPADGLKQSSKHPRKHKVIHPSGQQRRQKTAILKESSNHKDVSNKQRRTRRSSRGHNRRDSNRRHSEVKQELAAELADLANPSKIGITNKARNVTFDHYH